MFQVSDELVKVIAQHDAWINAARCGQMLEEPTNPWPAITEAMVQAAEGITLGWGSIDEVAVDFLEAHDTNAFFDNTTQRYKLGALDTQELVERWEAFKPLRDHMAL